MSVINQMLKDLEERSPEKSSDTNSIVTLAPKTSPIKIISMTLIVILLLNGLGLYIWSLLQENQALKENAITAKAITSTKSIAPTADPSQPQALKPEKMKPRQHDKKREPAPNVAKVVQVNSATSVTEQVETVSNVQQKTVVQSAVQHEIVKVGGNEFVSEQKISDATKAPSTAATPVTANANPSPPANAIPQVKKQASMSVSRRHLTPEELIMQKISKAEKAINENNLTKAETLFEEVLIIDAKQQQARKKLAALWFGRKAFNEAINLLSQGIALAPDNNEFRSMQAHVYLQQGNLKQAHNSLKSLANVVDEEYQLLIVNISQQIGENDAAIDAYKILLGIQPQNSRWHLGLATLYDKTSQFVLAVSEYQLALKYQGLSQNSSHFANQRIQALGVK